jgi:CHAT domain-containing protein
MWANTGTAVRGGLFSDASSLEAEVREFHRLCASPTSNPDELRLAGRRLFARLIKPYAREVGASRRISIETDDWLSSLPFGALIDEGESYLAERHEISMISNATGRREQPEVRLSAASPALIVSAPAAGGRRGLPYLRSAELETSELAARLSRPPVLQSGSADLGAMNDGLREARLFHFAGHGWANGGNAALILGPDGAGGSRLLTATDLADQDWSQCLLAVLSACLTASGEDAGPVNPYSLVRAFLAAGVRRVVAARWSIDDESTRTLMTEFYSALFQGMDPASALHQASNKIRIAPGWKHPYYWAAFDIYAAP